MNFERLGLAPGVVLTASKDAAITCGVAGPHKVKFRGEVLSPSAAAMIAIRELGYDWSAISGSDFWTYGGEKLSALAARARNIDEAA